MKAENSGSGISSSTEKEREKEPVEEEYVYRISTGEEWESLQASGTTLGGQLDQTTGCIHLSKFNQVEWVLNNFFENFKRRSDQDLLYLLQIDAKKLGDGLVQEAVGDDASNVFPHFYGPLPLDAVAKAEKLILSPHGNFTCSLLT